MKFKLLIVITIGVACISLIALMFLNNGNYLETSGWNSFKVETIKKYPDIKDSYIYSIRPTLFIGYIIEKDNINEINKIFGETNNFLKVKGFLNEIQMAHEKKYGGSITQIIVEFRLESDTKGVLRQFSTFISKDETSEQYIFEDWQIQNY